MKKQTTEIVFILDRSGSMSGLEKDTIGGFNSILLRQREEGSKTLISTVLFDNEQEVIHDRVNLNYVQPLTSKEYYVRGSTALLDAIGLSIDHIAKIHKYSRPEDRPDKTLFVITTDGMENSSHIYSYSKIKQMIKKEKSQYGWEFIFLGANIDSEAVAESIGINKEYAADFVADSLGNAKAYESINEAITMFKQECRMDASWAKVVKEDKARRDK